MTVKHQPKPAEGFGTLEDEVSYWGKHGSSGAVDENAQVEVEIGPEARARMISVRIPGDLLDELRSLARTLGTPYQTLMKELLRFALLHHANTRSPQAQKTQAISSPLRARRRERAVKCAAGAIEYCVTD